MRPRIDKLVGVPLGLMTMEKGLSSSPTASTHFQGPRKRRSMTMRQGSAVGEHEHQSRRGGRGTQRRPARHAVGSMYPAQSEQAYASI